MADESKTLREKLDQNREYLKEARKAVAEARTAISRHPLKMGLPEDGDRQELTMSRKGNMGAFVTTRNGKGWLKLRV